MKVRSEFEYQSCGTGERWPVVVTMEMKGKQWFPEGEFVGLMERFVAKWKEKAQGKGEYVPCAGQFHNVYGK